jgi:hypothetical protein
LILVTIKKEELEKANAWERQRTNK